MRKIKKFADGGSSDRTKARYDRKIADIESDYAKAKVRKTGRALDVAEAKYEQRMADAKDDLAKWTGADRTATRAGEKAAERNLSLTRRYGSAKPKFEDKPLVGAGPSDADIAKINKDTAATVKQGLSDSGSFKAAFAAARKDPSSPKTFTWRGKSYTTDLASEKPKAVTRTTTPAKTTSTPAAKANAPAPAAKANTPAPAAKANTPAKASAAPVKTTPGYTQTLAEKRAAELRAQVAANRKLAADKKNYSGAAIAARLGDTLGFNTSRENTARSLEQQAQRQRWREVEAKGASDAADYAKAQKRAARIAAGNKPNATPTEKFYAKNPDAMKKGGSVKGYAKGGKIDGCAVRGKTKAMRKK